MAGKFLKDFKTFAMRGNVIDLAVAVVIGTAFNNIVSSLVENIVTPLIKSFSGGIDFSGLSFVLGGAVITYGAFFQAIIDFVIIAFSVFVAIRVMNSLHQKEEEKKEAQGPSKEVELLTEIRDTLKKG